jgi:hypothetical protein
MNDVCRTNVTMLSSVTFLNSTYEICVQRFILALALVLSCYHGKESMQTVEAPRGVARVHYGSNAKFHPVSTTGELESQCETRRIHGWCCI